MACNVGEWISRACNLPENNTICSACSPCLAGTYLQTRCSTSQDTHCPSYTECDTTTQYQAASGTASSDRLVPLGMGRVL